MENERINSALKVSTDTRSVVIGAGVISDVDGVFKQSFGDQSAVIVADENTYAAAGGRVHDCFLSAGRAMAPAYLFPGQPVLYADYKNVLEVEAALRELNAVPVAVGSGTINDIVKLATHRLGRKYMVVATAASMDGYTAFGAAITRDGYKQTMTCPAPYAVLADLEVLANAPHKMTASGYADLLGKITAGADWLLADALESEPIERQAWSLVQDSLRAWTADPQLLQSQDQQAIGNLVEGLVLTGLSMQAIQSSRPASGSEHLISHLWEMQETSHGAVSHGFKVGLGSIASASLYERLLARDLGVLDIAAICRAWPERATVEQAARQVHANPTIAGKAVEQSLAKYIDAGQLRQRLELLRERWPNLRQRLQTQLMTANQLRQLLKAAGCPTHPSEIGKDLAQLKASFTLARQIRSRYTVLDLAIETGCLPACLDELFNPGGFWANHE